MMGHGEDKGEARSCSCVQPEIQFCVLGDALGRLEAGRSNLSF